MNRLSALPRAGFALIALAALGFSATKEVDLKRDVRMARAILTGEVNRIYSYYGNDGEIYSDVTLRVTGSLKQSRELADSIEFTTPGGEVGDVGVYFTGTPQFKLNEPVLVFLEEDSTGSAVATAKYELNEGFLAEVGMQPIEVLVKIRENLDEIGQPVREQEWVRASTFVNSKQPGNQKKAGGDEIVRNAGDATCYKLMGPKWRIPNVTYKLDPTLPTSFLPAISTAVSSLNNAGVALRLALNNFSANVVSFGPIAGQGILAQTRVSYQPSTQTIVSFTLVYNRSFSWSTTGEVAKFDVQGIGLHEFGHAVGLDHPPASSCNDQTMWFSAGAGETNKRSLEVGDLAGLAAMYGASAPSSATPPSAPPPVTPSLPPGQAPPVPGFSGMVVSGLQITSSPITLALTGTSFLTNMLQIIVRGPGCPTTTGCVIDTRSIQGLTTTNATAVFIARGGGAFNVSVRNSAVGGESAGSFRLNVAISQRR